MGEADEGCCQACLPESVRLLIHLGVCTALRTTKCVLDGPSEAREILSVVAAALHATLPRTISDGYVSPCGSSLTNTSGVRMLGQTRAANTMMYHLIAQHHVWEVEGKGVGEGREESSFGRGRRGADECRGGLLGVRL